MAEQPLSRAPGGQFRPQPPPPPAPGEMRGEHGPQPGHAGAKVTVACKLPHGLLLRVFDWETRSEPVLGGGIRDVKVAAARPEMVRVRGNAVPFGVVPRWAIEDGFALTPGVDKEFFDLWMEQNRNHAAVRAGLIFAFEKHEDAASEARNRASLKSGMEQLDPQNLPRGIQPADRRDE